MKLKKRLLSLLLVLAVMVTFMPAVTLTANAASKKTSTKVYTVSSEKNGIGDNTKYTYNKKGFVNKTVTTITKKNSDSDTIETITTTFKYNKKNRIYKKTTKDVEKVTTYKTNKTTGKSTGQSLGTVTTTTTDVTKYTYKKGRATKAVTTSTTVKSGSITETDVYLNLSATQLSNGKYIAGYNDWNPDGTTNEEYTSANAYYYTGSVDNAAYTATTTTTYKNNGNGTYTETVKNVATDSNFERKENKVWYKQDGNGRYVTCAETDPDREFSRIESVSISLKSGVSPDNYTDTTTTVIKDQDVTTTTFKYDTKKRVKQAKVGTVDTYKESITKSSSSKYTESDTDEIWDDSIEDYKYVDYTTTGTRTSASSSSRSYKATSSRTEKYSYNKNNRKTKAVVTDKGVQNSTETFVGGRENSTNEYTTAYSDGKTASGKETTTYSGANDTTTTVFANGKRTETTTKNPYKRVRSEIYTGRDGSTDTTNSTTDYTFYKNGGSMTVTSTKASGKESDGESYVTDSKNTRYEFDESGNKYAETSTYSRTTTPVSGDAYSYSYTESVYNDGNGSKTYYDKWDDEVYTDDATVKAAADRATAALTATGTPYITAQSRNVKARPSKTTTKYTYDKQGNLKTAKTSESWTAVETLRNEKYGNEIYQYDAEGKTEEVETTVTHTYKNNSTKENTVKSGSNRVKSATTTGTYSSDRSTPSYSVGGRVTYTLKSKTIAKKSVRNDVELQQWMIQNPDCGSVAGLF